MQLLIKMFLTTLIFATPLAYAADSATGEKLYKQTCFICHGTGVAGAPKFGDKAAWAPRIEKGEATLVKHAIEGFNTMPPKGGCADCSDDDIKAAVSYMIENAK